MKLFIFLSLMLLASLSNAGEQQVYVLAGEPYEDFIQTFPVLLYRVESGGLTKIRTVVTRKQNAIFVRSYQDKGYVIIASYGTLPCSFLVDIIDLKAISRERSYDVDTCPDRSYIKSYLANKNGRLVYVFLASKELNKVHRGIDFKTQAVVDWDPADVKYAYSYGSSGAFVDGGDFLDHIRLRNTDKRAFVSRWKYDLGWDVPQQIDMPRRAIRQWLNNDQMRVLLAQEEWKLGASKQTWHILDKVSNKWSTLELSGTWFGMRPYRQWLVVEEVYDYDPNRLELFELETQRSPPFLSARKRFESRDVTPTGRLRLYNVHTKQRIVHDTGEANSEVLLVDENDVVYYRVSDELRRATLVDGQWKDVRLLAKTPKLWGVHWLVLGYE